MEMGWTQGGTHGDEMDAWDTGRRTRHRVRQHMGMGRTHGTQGGTYGDGTDARDTGWDTWGWEGHMGHRVGHMGMGRGMGWMHGDTWGWDGRTGHRVGHMGMGRTHGTQGGTHGDEKDSRDTGWDTWGWDGGM